MFDLSQKTLDALPVAGQYLSMATPRTITIRSIASSIPTVAGIPASVVRFAVARARSVYIYQEVKACEAELAGSGPGCEAERMEYETGLEFAASELSASREIVMSLRESIPAAVRVILGSGYVECKGRRLVIDYTH